LILRQRSGGDLGTGAGGLPAVPPQPQPLETGDLAALSLDEALALTVDYIDGEAMLLHVRRGTARSADL